MIIDADTPKEEIEEVINMLSEMVAELESRRLFERDCSPAMRRKLRLLAWAVSHGFEPLDRVMHG